MITIIFVTKRVLLSLIIEEILGSLPYNRLIVGCVFQFKSNTALSIQVLIPCSVYIFSKMC